MTTAPAVEAAPEPASKSSDKKTLFVKNLPDDATKEQLELVFSEVGKLRHCFVVKKRKTDEFRGIGFVTFVDEDSAQNALKRSFKLGDNQLDVTIAADKKKAKDAATKPKPKISFAKDAKQARKLQKAKLIVRNLSFKATEADLKKKFSAFGEVLNVTIPKKEDGKVRGFAFVQFKQVPEAAKAVKALNAKEILGRPVAVDFAVAKGKFEEIRKTKTATKNDSKKSTGDIVDSDETASEYGADEEDSESDEDVSEGDEPRKTAKGKAAKKVARKSSGGEDSEDSEEESDGSDEDEDESEVEFGSDGEVRLVKAAEVKDRKRILGSSQKTNEADEDTSEDEDDEDEEMQSEEEGSDDEDMEVGEGEDGSEDSDEEEDSSEEENEQLKGAAKKKSTQKQDKAGDKAKKKASKKVDGKESESDSDWGHTPNDDSSEDEDEDREKAQRKREMIKKEDLSRTVFVKNISFDTTQTTFQERMKQYGPYKFCLICMDKMLGRSKGTGFVKFEERADAARCVESLQAGELTLDGKTLSGSIAMKRDQLQDELQKKMETKKQPKDKRNLYLAREGFIRGGTSVAARISDHDLKVRAKLESSKKKALKNLHNFVSSTRLCVHNLPQSCDDKQLRKIFARVVDRNAKITEARVMRNMKRLGPDGKGVSKGFGFVNFERHEDALKALRAVNNNPTVFTDQMRPIVSFSIENRAALMVKERRLKRSQQKLQEIRQMKGGDQGAGEGAGKDFDYQQGRRQPFEGLRAQVDMKVLPRRVGEKVRLDPKRRQHQLRLKRLAREAKRKPEFRKKKEKKPRGPTKAQMKEQRDEKHLNQVINRHRQKMRHSVQ